MSNAREGRVEPAPVLDPSEDGRFLFTPEGVHELTDRSKLQKRREWLELFLSYSIEKRSDFFTAIIDSIFWDAPHEAHLDRRGFVAIPSAKAFNDFFLFCIESTKNPDVSAMGMEALMSCVIGALWQQYQPGPVFKAIESISNDAAKLARSVAFDTSMPYPTRIEAVKFSALILLGTNFSGEGGYDSLFNDLFAVISVASKNLPDPLLPAEDWVFDKESSKEDEENVNSPESLQEEYLAAVIRSFEAILPFVSHDVLLSKTDELFGSLEAMILSFESAEIVDVASHLLVSVFEILTLHEPEKDREDVTLISDRLDFLANAEHKNHQKSYENRQRWENRKTALEDASGGIILQIELKWVKFWRIERQSWSQRIAPEKIRSKADAFVVPWSLAATLRFLHDVIGPDFSSLIKRVDTSTTFTDKKLCFSARFFDLIDIFDAWALPRLKFEMTSKSIFKTFVEDMKWSDKMATKKHSSKYNLVRANI